MITIKRLALWMTVLLSPFSSGLEPFPYQYESSIQLRLGDIKNVRVTDITQVAVGNEDVVSVSILNDEELLFIPLEVGHSDIVVWHTGNRKSLFRLRVAATESLNTTEQLAQILAIWPGLEVDYSLPTPFISGQLASIAQLEHLHKTLIQAGLEQRVVNAVRLAPRNSFAAVQGILSPVSGLAVTLESGQVLLSGSYDPKYSGLLDTVLTRFPEVINRAMKNPAPLRKMIGISVRVVEIKRRHLERLGLRWQEILSGPAFALAQQPIANPYFTAVSPVQGAEALVANIPMNDNQFYGAVGMATQMQSQIELLTESGSARIVAEPMLSTTENTPATFHSGGQIPYPVQSEDGTLKVEYQPYGIRLNVLPSIGTNNNLIIDFSAEVSSIDQGIAINGVPGLATRQVTSVASTESGETVVISGLVSQNHSLSESKLPWLGDLPVIGRLFKTKSKDTSEMELLILLTPTIDSQNLSSGLQPLVGPLAEE